ncbi:MAG: OsmC family protein [Chloroflexi bacterium]|nr:OsmC family protein [Chloroflexota bacterium]MBI3763313.1 OsmC family protein [Chloroflexota bacterium]
MDAQTQSDSADPAPAPGADGGAALDGQIARMLAVWRSQRASTILATALEQRIGQLRSDRSGKLAVFRAETRRVEILQCEAQIRKFPPLVIDEPPVVGGSDLAPNPVELTLAALGACQEIMYSICAELMGVRLDEVEVSVKGFMDLRGMFDVDPHPAPGFTRVEYRTRLKSAEPEARLRALAEMVESHCPVLDIFTRPIPVKGSVEFLTCEGS